MLLPKESLEDCKTAVRAYWDYCDALRTGSKYILYTNRYLDCGDLVRILDKRRNIKSNLYPALRRALMWHFSERLETMNPATRDMLWPELQIEGN